MRASTLACLLVAAGFSARAGATTISASNTAENVTYLSGPGSAAYDIFDKATPWVTPPSAGDEFATSQAALALTAAQAARFADRVDVFWDAGDYANGAFLATSVPLIRGTRVPEPATLALLAACLFTLAALHHGHRRPS